MPRKSKTAKKDTSFATWKFELEDTVNADPLCDGSCLKLVRAYLNFMSDPNSRPYASILSLKIATSLHEGAIVKARRTLEKLGYFIKDGFTSSGAVKYRIVNSRRNVVLDHQAISQETLKRLQTEKKEKERSKSKAEQDRSADMAGPLSHAESADLNPEQVCGYRRDRSADIADNTVEDTVEDIILEKGNTSIGPSFEVQTPYSIARSGDDANQPLPVPDTSAEADHTINAICEGSDITPLVRTRMKKMLMAGVLTPNLASRMVVRLKEEAA